MLIDNDRDQFYDRIDNNFDRLKIIFKIQF